MRAAALPPQPRRGDPWTDAAGVQGAAPAPAGAACSARHSSSLRLDGVEVRESNKEMRLDWMGSR